MTSVASVGADDATPVVSFLLDAVGAESRGHLDQTVASVLGQSDDDWQLIVHGLIDSDAVRRLGDVGDPRVRVVDSDRRDPGERAQLALEQANGTYVAVLDGGDELDGCAVSELRQTMATGGAAPDIVYTDESSHAGGAGSAEVVGKPEQWSPTRLRSHRWTGRLCALRREAVNEVGGFASGLDGAHEEDLLLRIAEMEPATTRISRPLCRRREGDTAGATERGRLEAVQRHLDRSGTPGIAEPSPLGTTISVVRRPATRFGVSVVIPTSGRSGLAWGERRSFVLQTVLSLLANTSDHDVQIIVVHSEGTPPPIIASLRIHTQGRIRIVGYGGQYNFALMANHGLMFCQGRVSVVMHDCVEPDSSDFLGELSVPLMSESVGLTGPRLLRSNGQHMGAGVAVYADRDEAMFKGMLDSDPGPQEVLFASRECSALLPTCLAARAETWMTVGGFSAAYPTLSHLDLAAKIGTRGMSRVWVAGARLRVFPQAADVGGATRAERDLYLSRWPTSELDPFVPSYGARLMRVREREALRPSVSSRASAKPS